jgi:DNA-binding GntR family transcriptional regulator
MHGWRAFSRDEVDGDSGSGGFSRSFAPESWAGSLVGAIAEAIAQAIIEGRLRPGDDLNSIDLSRRFDTSRATVREALLLLEKEGLVEIVTNLRPRVRPIGMDEVRQIYQVRASLYGLVAELIVDHATDDQLATLQPSLERIALAAQAGDVDAYFWANVAFRRQEFEICGNAVAQQILRSLGLRVLQLRHMSATPGDLDDARSNHEALLRAYRTRNAPLAVALTRTAVFDALARIERSGWTGAEVPERRRRRRGRPSSHPIPEQ